MIDDKGQSTHVEVQEDGLSKRNTPVHEVQVMGTVKLTEGDIVYVPRPTADPRDPLNMAMWQKYLVMVIISLCQYILLASIVYTH